MARRDAGRKHGILSPAGSANIPSSEGAWSAPCGKNEKPRNLSVSRFSGGEGGIRTLETL